MAVRINSTVCSMKTIFFNDQLDKIKSKTKHCWETLHERFESTRKKIKCDGEYVELSPPLCTVYCHKDLNYFKNVINIKFVK